MDAEVPKAQKHGTLTFPVMDAQGVAITKRQVRDILKTVIPNLLIAQETGLTKVDGDEYDYPHIHVAYSGDKKYSARDADYFSGLLGRPVYVSPHRSRDTAVAYVLKEDKEFERANFNTFQNDLIRARAGEGKGIKKLKAEAARAGDIEAMEKLDMMPNEIAQQENARPVVCEAKQKQLYVRHAVMDLEFTDNSTGKTITYHVDFNTHQVTLTRKGKDTVFEGRRGIWLYGPSRCGKTYQSRAMIQKYGGYELSDPNNWEGYYGQQLILLNEFSGRGGFRDPSEFRCFMDRARQNRKYGSKDTDPEDTFFIITSNYQVGDIYSNLLRVETEIWRPTIDALEAIFFQLEFRNVWKKEGVVTYGKSVQSFESDEDVDVPKKKAKVFGSKYEEEVAACQRLVVAGDTTVLCESGVWTKLLKCNDRMYTKTLLPNGDWRQEEI